MGLSGISPMSLFLILLIVVFLFGTQRIKNIGSDLGEAIRNFRKGLEGEQPTSKDKDQ